MRRAFGLAGVAAVSLIFAGCLSPGDPRGGRRISDAGLAHAVAYSAKHGERSLLVWQGGQVRLERYAAGMTPDTRYHIRSISKTVWALAFLRAADEGLLDLDQSVGTYLEEWRADPVKNQITARQLLSMTSGLESAPGPIYARAGRPIPERALTRRVTGSPGRQFEYGPAGYEVLGEILRRRLAPRGSDPETFLQQRVLTPLFISPPDLRRDDHGIAWVSAGMSLSPRELLKLGRFLCGGGSGGLAPVSPQRLREATTGSRMNPAFGLGLWLNAAAADGGREVFVEDWIGRGAQGRDWRAACLSQHAPADLRVALGSSGQRIYSSPSMGLVIVRLGEGRGFRDADFWRVLAGR